MFYNNLVKLIQRPELFAKLSNSLRIPFKNSIDLFVTRDISSAYLGILYYSPSIVIPLIYLLFLIKFSDISAHNKNRNCLGFPYFGMQVIIPNLFGFENCVNFF